MKAYKFTNRFCKVCNTEFTPTGSVQVVCVSCRHEYRKADMRYKAAQRRRAAGKTIKGSVVICSECGEDFVYSSGPQHRCASCQKANEVQQIHKWLNDNIDKKREYAKKARDNYLFDGCRFDALERDNYTCQHCGTKDDLHVHHIDGKGTTTEKEFRNNSIDNLITLCRTCHTTEHHRINHSACAPHA